MSLTMPHAPADFRKSEDVLHWFSIQAATSSPDEPAILQELNSHWFSLSPEDRTGMVHAVLHLLEEGDDIERALGLAFIQGKEHPTLIHGLVSLINPSPRSWLDRENPLRPDQCLGRALLGALVTGSARQQRHLQDLVIQEAPRFDATGVALWLPVSQDPPGSGLEALRAWARMGHPLTPGDAQTLAITYSYRGRNELVSVAAALLDYPDELRRAFAEEVRRNNSDPVLLERIRSRLDL